MHAMCRQRDGDERVDPMAASRRDQKYAAERGNPESDDGEPRRQRLRIGEIRGHRQADMTGAGGGLTVGGGREFSLECVEAPRQTLLGGGMRAAKPRKQTIDGRPVVAKE